MSEPPRRKRFQVHLSTAVVLMFAAGGLMWMNVTERGPFWAEEYGSMNWSSTLYTTDYGWPYTALERRETVDESGGRKESSVYFVVTHSNAAYNAAVALAILFAVWFVCERWIAWRAGRKKTPQ